MSSGDHVARVSREAWLDGIGTEDLRRRTACDPEFAAWMSTLGLRVTRTSPATWVGVPGRSEDAEDAPPLSVDRARRVLAFLEREAAAWRSSSERFWVQLAERGSARVQWGGKGYLVQATNRAHVSTVETFLERQQAHLDRDVVDGRFLVDAATTSGTP